MDVQMRKMSNLEFTLFYEWSIASHSHELMLEQGVTIENARQLAMDEFHHMLPDGLDTVDHSLMAVELSDTKELVGFLWTLQEEIDGRKQLFICDFMILESQRRKGYATTALSLLEAYARDLGCAEIGLFVSNQNISARQLYCKSDYQFLKPFEHGQYMVKSLY